MRYLMFAMLLCVIGCTRAEESAPFNGHWTLKHSDGETISCIVSKDGRLKGVNGTWVVEGSDIVWIIDGLTYNVRWNYEKEYWYAFTDERVYELVNE